MSRHWKERLDPEKHIDFMCDRSVGGRPVAPVRDNLLEHRVYFVNVCSFTFQFHSLQQVKQCLDYFQIKIHPGSREPNVDYEHYLHPWYQRVPQRLFEEARREKVVRALERALSDFMKGKC